VLDGIEVWVSNSWINVPLRSSVVQAASANSLISPPISNLLLCLLRCPLLLRPCTQSPFLFIPALLSFPSLVLSAINLSSLPSCFCFLCFNNKISAATESASLFYNSTPIPSCF
ncbi:hypothetical protein ILYODFUR_011638, partial [Ilyodon furcidens]